MNKIWGRETEGPLQAESDPPQRIQLRRSKGWRMPPNTVKVDRSTKWGNPFRVGAALHYPDIRQSPVELFREWLSCRVSAEGERQRRRDIIREIGELRGKNLACWCKPGDACHADVLLEMANAPASLAEGLNPRPQSATSHAAKAP